MPIQINVELPSREGFNVPAGSYCVLDIRITLRKMMEIDVRYYKDKPHFDNLGDAFFPVNPDLLTRYVQQLTNQEYAGFTNTLLHQFIQGKIELVLGPGSTQLVQ